MLLIQWLWLWVIETKSVNTCCTNIMKCCENLCQDVKKENREEEEVEEVEKETLTFRQLYNIY